MTIIKRVWNWLDVRTGASAIEPIAKHPVPSGTTWAYVFGSGTLFAFLLQVVTGITLLTTYVSSAEGAYQSLQYITNEAFLGKALRGTHYFGASAMVFLVGVHMVRIILTGSFKFPREVQWLTGSVLLLLTFLIAFTGQLLRWDQIAVWTAVVGGQQMARVPLIGVALARFWISGEVVNAATLSRFFSLHVVFLPLAIFAVLGIHLYLVLRNGISEPPVAGKPVDPATYRQEYDELLEKDSHPFWPDAAWRDVVFGATMIAAVVALGAVVGAPKLSKPPDPAIIEALPRPDWYLLWYFAVLALLPPGIEPWVMVGAPLLLAVFLFGLPFVANRGERHPKKRPWVVVGVVVTVMAIGILWKLGADEPWSPDFNAKPLPEQVVGASSGPVYQGGQLFFEKGCEYCHTISGYGGTRGPNLTYIGNRLSASQMTWRILNGGINMPAFGGILKPGEVQDLVAFLQSRSTPQ
jgi:ubiquinol-cytochrome c reductase cytochrome b subunit